MRLQGNVAIVTGGGGGLGEGISSSLAGEGASIFVSDINLQNAKTVAARINEFGGHALALQADVTNAKDCAHTVAAALETYGRLDTLVCNAGADGLPRANPETTPLLEHVLEEDWDIVMNVNLKGIFLSCRAAISHFKDQAQGRIINISSIALQLAPYHVNANCICPGIIWTSMWERLATYMTRSNPALAEVSSTDAFNGVVQQMIPFGKPQTVEDIGNTAVFLASDDAKEITAQALNVCGGIRMN
jgi:NAD(P)-dependent dehydrogenase (short-subunit alcohol dehydrogenase family)